MKRLIAVAAVVAILMTLSGCTLPFVGEWMAQQEIKQNDQLEQEILANLVPAERFEITAPDGTVLLTQDDVAKAEWHRSFMNDTEDGAPVVHLYFTTDGAKKLAEATETYQYQELPMLLDGEEIARPTVFEPIRDGEVILSGGSIDSYESAVRIAARIDSTLD